MFFSDINYNNKGLQFNFYNVDPSIPNSLRRVILSEIENVAPHFDPYNQSESDIEVIANTSSLSNEFLGHRLSLVPIMLSKEQISNYQPDSLQFVLKVKNTTNDRLVVTSKDIQVFKNNKLVSQKERDSIFPPNKITKDYILIHILKPNPKNQNEGQEIDILYQARQGIAKTHAKWSVVSLCVFTNLIDDSFVDKQRKELFDHQKKLKLQGKDLNISNNRFETIEKLRCFKKNSDGEPYEYNFKLFSETRWSEVDIVSRAFDVLIEKVQLLKDQNNYDTSKQGRFHLISMNNQSNTLGYLFQSFVFKNPTIDGQTCSYIGYTIPHPLIEQVVFKLGFDEENDDLHSFIASSASNLIGYLKKIQTEWNEKNVLIN